MQEEEFFRSETVVITRTLARFGGTSYSISNISLVRLGFVKRANPLAVILGVIGSGLLLYAFNQPSYLDDNRNMLLLVGFGLVVAAVTIQILLPKKEFTFVLKANSGDVETITTEDQKFAGQVKSAIEEAIALRI